MIQLQAVTHHKKLKTNAEQYRILKRNLLRLTERWANSYDADYDKAFFATHAYIEFEEEILRQEIEQVYCRELALDFGCATGRFATKLSSSFDQVIGYDISPHMIKKANERPQKPSNTTFLEIDLEQGIPQADGTASLVVMNLGTASDMRDISGILKGAARILKSNGRFFFSFYNKDALLYQWDFVPWPVGLAAEINTHKHCLDVHFGSKVLSVYARPYTVTEVKNLFPSEMKLSKVLTYPTLSSILPSTLFDGKSSIQKSVMTIDRQLATAFDGAYIIVTGQKQ